MPDVGGHSRKALVASYCVSLKSWWTVVLASARSNCGGWLSIRQKLGEIASYRCYGKQPSVYFSIWAPYTTLFWNCVSISWNLKIKCDSNRKHFRLKNVYFVFLLELRALLKVGPYLQNELFYTGNEKVLWRIQFRNYCSLYLTLVFSKPEHVYIAYETASSNCCWR